MTWTVLPQGFSDSPYLFGQAFSWDLLDLDLGPNGKILQYIDDLLICSPDEKNAQLHAIQVLNFLIERGYKVSHAKAQMVETKVTYLGVQVTHRSRRLFSDRIQGILQLPSRMTQKQLQAFLGLTSERVTGRKDRGLQTEEIGCKCQTFLSLLSGRRRQTSNIFFFSIKFKRRFFLKCYVAMTPGFT